LNTGEFIHSLGDTHIYKNHIQQVKTQLSRKPFASPSLILKKEVKSIEDLENLEWEDFQLENYKSYSTIKAEVAV
jgi:thymidylate synthase